MKWNFPDKIMVRHIPSNQSECLQVQVAKQWRKIEQDEVVL